MKNSKIEWCNHTDNFWWGCSEVSAGCQHCYAKEIAMRFKKDCWRKSDRLFRISEAIKELSKLERSATKRDAIETVFINSMGDFFDERVAPEIRISIWSTLKVFKHLQFLILTKRANVMMNHIARHKRYVPKNVHFGITAENQKMLDERMKALEGFKEKVFLSCEPLLEEIDITPYLDRIDWVICGGETGRKARYFNPMWAQRIFEDTHNFDSYIREWTPIIPFFFKKFGDNNANVKTGEEWLISTVREYPKWHPEGVKA